MSKVNLTEYEKRRLWPFWLLALLLHLALALWLGMSATPVEEKVASLAPLKVRFRQTPRQIVDTNQKKEKPRKPTDLIAPKESAAEKEQVAPKVGPTQNSGGSTPMPKKSRRKSLEDLLPDAAALASRDPSRQSNYIERPKGPVTLLNANGAPWSQWMIDSGYRVVRYLNLNAELMSWYLRDFRRLHFPAEVHFVLQASGTVAEATMTRSSGSEKIDDWFRRAALSGFTGRNPPKELLQGAPSVQLVAQLYADHIALGRP